MTAVILGLIVAVGLIEICLRIFGPPYYRFNNLSQEYYSNSRGYYDVIRVENGRSIYGLDYHEDLNGFRVPADPERWVVETPEKYILGLGDSFTYGRGVRYEDIYLTRLQEILNRGSRRVSIKNCGVVGAGIQDVVDIYVRESSTLPAGSLVMYGLVLNDFGLMTTEPIRGLNFIDINNGGYTYSPLRKHSAFVNFVFHAIETRRLHTATLRAYLESFEGENAENGFQLLGDLNEKIVDDGGTLLVVTFPLLYHFENYRFLSIHEKIATSCKEHGILILDLFPAFSRHSARELWSNPTDHHPNDIAHEIAAREIADFISDEVPDFLALPATEPGAEGEHADVPGRM